MGSVSMRRLGAVGAVVFVALIVVSQGIGGQPPDFGSSGAKITSFVDDNHKALVIGVLLLWLAVVVLVGVLAQLVETVREAGHADGSVAIAIAAGAAVALLTAGAALLGALTQLAVNGADDGIVRAVYQTDQFVFAGLNWVTLVLVLALMRAALEGVFPRWSLVLNGLIGVTLVLGGISVRGAGVLAAGTGLFAMIGFIGTMVLFLEIAVLLWQSAPGRAGAPVAATTPV